MCFKQQFTALKQLLHRAVNPALIPALSVLQAALQGLYIHQLFQRAADTTLNFFECICMQLHYAIINACNISTICDACMRNLDLVYAIEHFILFRGKTNKNNS